MFVEMYDGLYWFTVVACFFAWTSLLPDPYAFNHTKPRDEVLPHITHKRLRYWHHVFKLRSVVSHTVTLAFALVICVMLVWVHYSENTYKDEYERYVLMASVVVAVCGVLFLQYASGLVVSLALGWIFMVHYGINATVLWTWFLSGAAAIAVSVVVTYLLSSYLATKIVSYFQYPLAVAFTASFSVVVLQHGDVSHFAESGIREQRMWPTVIGIGIVFFVYCVAQWSYATRSMCGSTAVKDNFSLPPGATDAVSSSEVAPLRGEDNADSSGGGVASAAHGTPLWGVDEKDSEPVHATTPHS
jgi:hypothetical protein